MDGSATKQTTLDEEGNQSIRISDYQLVLTSTSFQFCLSDTLLKTLSAEFDVVIEQATGLTLSPSLEGCRYLRWAGRYNVSISPQLRCHTPKLGSPWQLQPTPMDSTRSTQEGEEREISKCCKNLNPDKFASYWHLKEATQLKRK